MAIEYTIEREYVRIENGDREVKKESEFTYEEIEKIRLKNQKKYLNVLGYKGIKEVHKTNMSE